MKKILSMGIASAVLALTAVAASADAATGAAFDIAGDPLTPVTGDTYTVTFTATKSTALQFQVSYTGLELVDAKTGDETMQRFSKDNGAFSGVGIREGDAFLTLTFTVTAAANDAVSVSVAPAAGASESLAEALPKAPYTVVVGDGSDESDVSDPTSSDDTTSGDETSSDDTTSGDETSSDDTTSGDNTSSDDTASGSGSTGDDGKNPPTGIALAIVPAVLAGAGVVVAKKRK